MKSIPFWALIALSHTSAVFAQATETSAASSTSTSTTTTPSCTASEIARICDYPEPGPEFAVASSGRDSCWNYCHAHTPCSFVIFVAGNPNTGTGTCWLYPGESFDADAGSSDCGSPSLYVYSQPECDGDSEGPTPTSSDACTAATETPVAVASGCGIPPPEDCFDMCVASDSASNCLSQCAEADSCSYVIFNPRNPSNSPYAPGTCWMIADGTYDAGSITACTSDPEQFVYENLCPKPSPASSTPASSGSSTSPSAGMATSGSGTAGVTTDSTVNGENSAPGNLPSSRVLVTTMVMGLVLSIWRVV